MNETFSIAKEHAPKTGLTISTSLIKGHEAAATAFSLGGGTDISPETYDHPVIYLGLSGCGEFLAGGQGVRVPVSTREATVSTRETTVSTREATANIKEAPIGDNAVPVCANEALLVPSGTLCGVKTNDGFVYTEIISKEELAMNEAVKPGEAMKLAELVPYETGSIVNLDVASNEAMKFMLMAFDEGTGLTPHRAPGDALVFALEGKATIGYEGEEHEIEAGENFRFAKGGLHSVTANGKFKMALLLVLK